MKLESLKNVQELQVNEAAQIKGGGRDGRSGGTTSTVSNVTISSKKKPATR